MKKVVLITGATKGIGLATALEFADSTTKLILIYHEDELAASSLKKNLSEKQVEYLIVKCDLSERKEVLKLKEKVLESFGRIDILVNNAGAIARPAEWNLISEEDEDYTINLNLNSVMWMTKAFAEVMIQNKTPGRIINTTSTYAINGAAPVLAYTAAKAGVISITRAMARELGKHGITVNAVAPGNIDTQMTAAAGEQAIEWAISTTPLGRLGKPEEIAEAIRFLCQSNFITGHVLVVDGGQILNM